ncbi:MAG: response regulator transcription factor [Phycisphaerae bacterium]|nr:response regulator transcription factor [Phycisphaerae bacterium]
MRQDRVLLVDDHAFVREMLSERLRREPNLTVVGCVGDGAAAIDCAREQQPTIVVMDVDMPGLGSFDAARRIRELLPDARLMFLSAYTSDHYIDEALRVGACGYVSKGESAQSIVAAIRDVAAGKASFSDAVRARIVVDRERVHLREGGCSRGSKLTERERKTLRYLAQGLPKKEIAGLMHVGEKTVEKHTENLMRKLDIHDRVVLTRYAIREGYTEV